MVEWICEQCENRYLIKLEADFSIEPTWCGKCGLSIDIYLLPLSISLMEELLMWGNNYGKWIDFKSDSLAENGIELEKKFNRKGLQLTEKVKNELGSNFTVDYKSSTSAEWYKNKDC